jgi:hypothetical protein
MGEPSIVDKLQALLDSRIDRESKAVYFMVEARKLIEHHEDEVGFPAFPLMQFYCDWCRSSASPCTSSADIGEPRLM